MNLCPPSGGTSWTEGRQHHSRFGDTGRRCGDDQTGTAYRDAAESDDGSCDDNGAQADAMKAAAMRVVP